MPARKTSTQAKKKAGLTNPSPSRKPTRRRPPQVLDSPSAPLLKNLPAGTRAQATHRHIAFALEYFTHASSARAYRAVYDPQGQRSPAVVEASAARIKAHPEVQAELTRLQVLHRAELEAQAAQAAADQKAAIAAAIATREEILIFQTRLMRASSSDFTAANRDLIHVIEDKVLAPVKHDKEGEEIENPDADAEGYVTSVKRLPPSPKDRLAASIELAKMQGFNKADTAQEKIADSLTDLLITLRGGGKS